LPMGFFQISRAGQAQQCLWNHVAGEGGLEGVGVTANYVKGGQGTTDVEKEIALTWNGWAMTRKVDEEQSPKTQNSRKSDVEAIEERSTDATTRRHCRSKSKPEATKQEGTVDHPRLAVKRLGRPPKYE
ncbi:hypothetical protein LTS18_014649, partial [Coniosporium uncinatum]